MSDTKIEQEIHDAMESTEFVDNVAAQETKDLSAPAEQYDNFVEEVGDSVEPAPVKPEIPVVDIPQQNEPTIAIPDIKLDATQKKKDLIAAVRDLYPKLGLKVPKNLPNRNKDELVQLLAAGMDKAGAALGNPPAQRQVIDSTGKPVQNKSALDPSDAKCKSAAGTLLKLNSLFGELCEGVSRGPYNKTGFVLDGYGQKVVANRDILLPAYAELYKRHHTDLNKFMGSYQIIIAANLTIAGSCAQRAEKKESQN